MNKLPRSVLSYAVIADYHRLPLIADQVVNDEGLQPTPFKRAVQYELARDHFGKFDARGDASRAVVQHEGPRRGQRAARAQQHERAEGDLTHVGNVTMG